MPTPRAPCSTWILRSWVTTGLPPRPLPASHHHVDIRWYSLLVGVPDILIIVVIWYRKNVLGGTKSSSLVSCPAPPARPARSPRHTTPARPASPRHETSPNKKGGQLIQLTAFRADGETRTHTGQRPLPPQSSVSTISPHPHV